MKNKLLKLSLALIGALIFLTPVSEVKASEEKTYTYNYDYWGDVQSSPDAYTVVGVYTAADLGLELNFKNPEGLYTHGKDLYICDTGNNRIVELKNTGEGKFAVEKIIDSIKGSAINTLNGPTDIAIDSDGNFYIADKGNSRIVKTDADFNFLLEFVKPNDSTLDENLVFQPSKISIDQAGRVYCVASGINKGLIKYENDGTFSGFVGATPVTYNFSDYLKKKFATQAQREQMVSFVPTEYDNLYMDHEGFIYACTGKVDEDDLKNGSADAIRKLNLLGNDILVKNGEWYPYGDLYMGEGGGYSGPSYFVDVTTFENDIYVCLDKNRGRLFGYDDQGRMVYAFGGNGNMDGYFRQPAAIEHIGYDLYVLDSLDCSITVFTPTEFGEKIYQAIDEFDAGNYEASEQSWRRVMDLNGNYDLAYIGIGRALLRQEKYKEAMEYFELKYDDENYSKAFKQYRKIWVEDHIVIIVIIILALFLIPLGISKVKAIKWEIATADIFKE